MISLSRYTALVAITLLITGCAGGSANREATIKQRQYFIKGEQLYLQHCSNCHQKDGQGLGTLYPPVANSDFVKEKPEEVICLIKHGIEGELVVNGIKYNMAMPPNPSLTDLEVAEIATFIMNNWGHNQGLIDVKTVSPLLGSCR